LNFYHDAINLKTTTATTTGGRRRRSTKLTYVL